MSQQAFPGMFRSSEHGPKQLQIHINVQSAATQTPSIATCCTCDRRLCLCHLMLHLGLCSVNQAVPEEEKMDVTWGDRA